MSASSIEASKDDFSYITPVGYFSTHTCGYCGGDKTGQSQKRRSYYARSPSMSAACYQALTDRNWRRSGSLLYRPNQLDACCPHYSLRVDAVNFRPAREHRQTINRFNRFIIGDAYAKDAARLYPKSREDARKRDSEFNLTERIHEVEVESLKQPPVPAHFFQVTMEPDNFTEEKFAVFENYQRTVHKEPAGEISRAGFAKFLCNSPLRRETVKLPDGREKRLGSYHQCYRLDGRLVAIGVLDLLPDAVSAVYFLYHESIHNWSPGKLGALREIALAQEDGYRWWYPGFYIHSCPKMRYKMSYSPQQILNPHGMEWVGVSPEILAKFDSKGYLDFAKTGDGEAVANSHRDPASDSAYKSDPFQYSNSSGYFSLLKSNMPGLPPIGRVLSYDYDSIPVRSGDRISDAVDVFGWANDYEEIMDGEGPRGQIAEIVAAVGLDIMPRLCLDLGPE
ncbi:arginine-tRNA-protein transferase [Xylaria sp. CBS 124048]|nr:arginine-tRNA-protein transferase [Xylaria sp. CBS 124048]